SAVDLLRGRDVDIDRPRERPDGSSYLNDAYFDTRHQTRCHVQGAECFASRLLPCGLVANVRFRVVRKLTYYPELHGVGAPGPEVHDADAGELWHVDFYGNRVGLRTIERGMDGNLSYGNS